MQKGFDEKDKQAVITALEKSGRDVECEDALHRACELGWLDVARILMNKFSLDPNISDFWGTKLRPLHAAARSDRLEAVEFLMANGASVDLEDANGSTALHYSLQEGHWEVAEYLANSWKGNIVKKNTHGVVPLVLGLNRAVDFEDHNGIVRCIKLYRMSAQVFFSIPYNILQKLHQQQWKDELRLLVQVAAEKEASVGNTSTPLSLIGASDGDIELLKVLVEYGTDISTTDVHGGTVLHVALLKGYRDIARYVITVAPHLINATNNKGESCSRFAVRSGSVDIVKLLVENGAQIEVEDNNGETPLFSALKEHHVSLEMTEYLVCELHCDLNHRNKHGDTPFSTELASLLYKRDIDSALWLLQLNIKSKRTFATLPHDALQLACRENLLPVIGVLLQQYHCDPLQPHPSTGVTALHVVYQMKDLPLAKVLLSQKPPNPLARNKYGQSLVDLAKGHEELLKLLDIAQLKRVGQARKPVKIFLLGGSQSGKTSVAQLLKKSAKRDILGSIRAVKRKPPTIGVRITSINHKDFGSSVMYDCSSHQQYYSSVVALIEDLVVGTPAVFIVVVNLTQTKEKVAREVQYWVNFVHTALHSLPTTGSQVIVIGSHADQSSINQWGFQNAYQSWVAEDPEPRVVAEKLVLAGGMMMDCHRMSASTHHLVSLVSQSCASIRACSVMPLQLEHLPLYSFCYYHFKSVASVLLSDLQASVAAEQNYLALPLEETSLVESLAYLHAKGLLLFLYDKHAPSSSVIVFDQTSLLNKGLGTVLAPVEYKVHHSINSSTGMVQLTDILQLVPQHNRQTLLLLFTKYSLCVEVAHSSVPSDPLLFFPSLVSLEKSDAGLQVYNDGHQSGWMLGCSKGQSNVHFNHRFTDLLHLTLADRFVGLTTEDRPTPTHSIWKNGIYWIDSGGIEVALEVSENRSHLILLLSSPRGSELKAVRLRSKLIHHILQLFSQYCLHPATEYLVSPDQVQYPLVCDYTDLFVCPLDQLPLALHHKDTEVQFVSATSKDIKIASLQEVLYFDTRQVPHGIFAALADLISRGEMALSFDLLSDIASALNGLISGETLALEILAMDPASLGGKSEVLEVLQMWTEQVEDGPLTLKEALDNYSIFCGRDHA